MPGLIRFNAFIQITQYAAFSSSLLGGIFGAFILSISIYYAIPIIMAFGFGEQFLLVVLALLMVGALTGDNFIKGLTSCFLGLIIGTIGTAPITGDPRYTFDTLYLIEGVPLPPFKFEIAEVHNL